MQSRVMMEISGSRQRLYQLWCQVKREKFWPVMRQSTSGQLESRGSWLTEVYVENGC